MSATPKYVAPRRYCYRYAPANENTSGWPREFLNGKHNPRHCSRAIKALLQTPGGMEFLKENRRAKPRA